MNAHTEFQIGIRADFYTRYRNTEDGPIEVTVDFYTIHASAPSGHCWYLADFETEDLAYAETVLATLNSNPDTTLYEWVPTDPIYGSEAWDSEAEYDLACFEADCYNEPRPLTVHSLFTQNRGRQ